jgi:hypothetical protein
MESIDHLEELRIEALRAELKTYCPAPAVRVDCGHGKDVIIFRDHTYEDALGIGPSLVDAMEDALVNLRPVLDLPDSPKPQMVQAVGVTEDGKEIPITVKAFTGGDYVGFAEEMRDQIAVQTIRPNLPEFLQQPMKGLVVGAEELVNMLQKKRSQDREIADFLVNAAVTLTGDPRGELMSDFFDDSLEEQGSISAWMEQTYAEHNHSHNAVLGVVEAALQLALAAGSSATELSRVFRSVIERRPITTGNFPEPVADEASELMLQLYAFCEAQEFPLEEAVDLKMSINRHLDRSVFLEQLKERISSGVPLVPRAKQSEPKGPETGDVQD